MSELNGKNLKLKTLLKMSQKEKDIALKPNCYHVIYRVMEGDNYAGGWSSPKTKTIQNLADIQNFGRCQILEVKPAFEFTHQFTDAVPQAEIDQAIADKKQADEQARKERELKAAQERLAKAEAALA